MRTKNWAHAGPQQTRCDSETERRAQRVMGEANKSKRQRQRKADEKRRNTRQRRDAQTHTRTCTHTHTHTHKYTHTHTHTREHTHENTHKAKVQERTTPESVAERHKTTMNPQSTAHGGGEMQEM